MSMIEGSYNEQYAKLWRYIEELRRINPGFTVVMELVNGILDMGKPRFERFYVCFAVYREGFKLGCRKFFGINGCHLKGPH